MKTYNGNCKNVAVACSSTCVAYMPLRDILLQCFLKLLVKSKA